MWVTNKTAITSIMSSGGYNEHENNLDEGQISDLGNKTYILKPVGIQLNSITQNAMNESDLVELSVVYVNTDTAKRDTNFDAFRSVLEALNLLSNFLGFEGNADFGQLGEDPNKSIGTVKFYFGIKEC